MNKRELTQAYQNLKSELSINCTECSALCCVALYFQKSDGFPENKHAGIPCKHLKNDFKCKIYEQLESKHLKGCIVYDCFGAGQKTTHMWKSIGSWDDRSIQSDVFQSFEKLRLLNQMLGYLIDAYQFCDDSDQNLVSILIAKNREITELNRDDFMQKDIEEHRLEVNNFLKSFTLNFSSMSNTKLINRLQMGKDFSNMNFDRADLSMTCLIASNFEKCSFVGTNFLGADVRDVNVYSTDLHQSLFLTQIQVNSMKGNRKTKLPAGLNIPNHWVKE